MRTTAGELTEGQSIPALNDAYVTDVTHTDETDVSLREGSSHHDYPFVIPQGYVLLSVDTGERDGYLILPADMPLDVTGDFAV